MEDICAFALERARSSADYAEVKAERNSHNEFVLKNGKPEVSGFDKSLGISVRVLVGGSMGFASTNNLDRSNVTAIVDEACAMAKAASGLVKQPVKLSHEDGHEASYSSEMKEPLADVGPEEKLAALRDVHAGLPQDVSVAGSFFELYDSITEKLYLNSEGSHISAVVPRIGFFGFLTVQENGETSQVMLQKGASRGWEALREWDLEQYVSDEAHTLQRVLTKGRAPPTGPVDVICGPEVTGIATHESCGHPYEADRILGREAAQAGESFVSLDMMGQQIGSEHVSVIDDPTIPHSYGFYLYDDEGVPARPRYLMKDGTIHELLHNRETAGQLGIDSNGSARCNNYNREPIVRMANTYVEAGDWTRDEVIAETKKGVIINSFMEWNIDDKRYNQRYVSREAYYVEDGEVRHPLKAAILEVTTPTFWSSIDAVADDIGMFAGNCGKGEPMQGIPVFMGGPTIRLRDIRLGVVQ